MVDAALYLVLGTADGSGNPWATPVYFAHSDYRDFLWVSRPTARHSRNIEAREEVGLVIFDSRVPINTGKAVYVEARAQEAEEAERAAVLEIYSQRAVSHGGTPVTEADVVGDAVLRLYRASASAHYVLDEHDQRVPVVLSSDERLTTGIRTRSRI
jgi:nitroimidazol reductase NimA-like FMN-containing flavoprotein (pyridoxamine 5'-phosphate oxidase superfamily)